MRIVVLGFNNYSRDLIAQIKRFPEYGDQVSIYHIQSLINSLSYGKEYVVEIPDPQGDGYRTLNDGLQAIPKYSTTVSNYIPWLIDEARNGTFDTVVDCMGDTDEETSLRGLVKEALGPNGTWIDADVINTLRMIIDGGLEWEPVSFSDEFLEKALGAWEKADATMHDLHISKRKADIEADNAGVDSGRIEPGYRDFNPIPDFDRDLIDNYVVNGLSLTARLDATRSEMYLVDNDCTAVSHGILTEFFGWHHTEHTAARVFTTPYLEIEYSTYIRYESDESVPIYVEDAEYVIEYVHHGCMNVIPPDNGGVLTLIGGSEESTSYGYNPKTNGPISKSVHKGLETIIFTYRRTDVN